MDPYGAHLPPYPYPYNGQLLALLGPGALAAVADRAGGLEDPQVHILRHLLGAGQEGRPGEQAGTGALQGRGRGKDGWRIENTGSPDDLVVLARGVHDGACAQ